MTSRNNKESTGPKDPPLDYFDLSYVTPLLTAATLEERALVPFEMGGPLKLAAGGAQSAGHFARRIIFEKFFKTLNVDFDTAAPIGSHRVTPNGPIITLSSGLPWGPWRTCHAYSTLPFCP